MLNSCGASIYTTTYNIITTAATTYSAINT